MREIRKGQNSTKLSVSRAGFCRVVKEASEEMRPGMRWSAEALEFIQDAREAYAVRFFEDSNSAALHAKRKTMMKKYMIYIKNLRMRDGVSLGSYSVPNKKLDS